jgi:hypothetical protein
MDITKTAEFANKLSRPSLALPKFIVKTISVLLEFPLGNQTPLEDL